VEPQNSLCHANPTRQFLSCAPSQRSYGVCRAVRQTAKANEFFNTNPHEAWIREMFAIAHIDYGRIDYGILNGKPQVWEINTNPMITALPRELRGPRPELPKDIEQQREQNRTHFHTNFRAALQAIDGDRASTATIPIAINPAVWQGESQWISWFLR
jgi:hypothetical protein